VNEKAELIRHLKRVGPVFLLGPAFAFWTIGQGVLAAVLGALALVGFVLGFLTTRRPRLTEEQALVQYPEADRATLIHSPDGTITFACPKGFYLGPLRRYVPVEGTSERVEAIAYDEGGHRLKFQLVVVRRDPRSHAEVETTEAHFVKLPPTLSADEGLNHALRWEKRRWRLRNGEIQSLTAA
jgi:hypothetical protein